ncbi:hypothetical protein NMG60_11018831 [Bertholletia excelsa]
MQMIYRAIVELNSKEGCTEESISEFIQKEYDDLPWAHLTFLKHHLQKLCESGEIAVTSNNTYLLADGIHNLNSDPSFSLKTEFMQQQGKKIKGRAKQCRKELNSENAQVNQHEVSSPERPPGFGLVPVKDLFKLKDQQHDHPCREGTLGSTPLLLSPSRAIVNLDSASNVQQEQQPVNSRSERPLELCAEQKACKSLPMISTSSLTIAVNSNPAEQCELVLSNSGGFSDVKTKTKGEVDIFSQTLKQMLEEQRQLRCRSQSHSKCEQPTTTTTTQLLELEHKQQVQQQPQLLGLEAQQVIKAVETSCQMQEQQGKQYVPMNTEPPSKLPHSERCVEPEIITKLKPCSTEGQQQSESLLAGVVDGHDLTKGLLDIPVQDMPMGLELATKEQSSQTKRMYRQLKRWGQITSTTKPLTILATKLFYSKKNQHEAPEIPNEDRPPDLKQAPVEESTQATEQGSKLHGRGKRIKCQSEKITITDSCNILNTLDHSEKDQVPEFPSVEGAQKLKDQKTLEKPLHSELRSLLPELEQATATTMTDFLPQHYQHEEEICREHFWLCKRRPLHDLEETSAEQLTIEDQKRESLRVQKKLFMSQKKMVPGSDNSCLALQSEPEQPPITPCPEIAEHQLNQEAHQTPPHCQSQTCHSKSEETIAATMTELVAAQDHPKEVQQQLDCQQESDTLLTVMELLPSDYQNQLERQLPASRGRGRPRKYPLNPQQMVKTKYQGQWRHHKDPHNPQQQQHEQTKRRGRGRPPKPRSDDTAMQNELP